MQKDNILSLLETSLDLITGDRWLQWGDGHGGEWQDFPFVEIGESDTSLHQPLESPSVGGTYPPNPLAIGLVRYQCAYPSSLLLPSPWPWLHSLPGVVVYFSFFMAWDRLPTNSSPKSGEIQASAIL